MFRAGNVLFLVDFHIYSYRDDKKTYLAMNNWQRSLLWLFKAAYSLKTLDYSSTSYNIIQEQAKFHIN